MWSESKKEQNQWGWFQNKSNKVIFESQKTEVQKKNIEVIDQ